MFGKHQTYSLFTNKTKPKYKLAGNFLLDFCFFHILTTSKDACKKLCTLTIQLSDWEDIVPKFKSKLKGVGYCDLTKFESMKIVVLLGKMKDEKNGFPYVCRLCDAKYKKLKKLTKNLYKYPHISRETKDFIENGISPSIDSILEKLNLD